MLRILILSVVLWMGCQSAQSDKTDAIVNKVVGSGTYDQKISFPFNTPKAKSIDEVKAIRAKMKDIIIRRQENLKGDLFDITYYYTAPHGFANLRKRLGPDNFMGQWMKFSKDFTYEYGIYDQVIGGGIYHYTEQDFFLMLYDYDEAIEPRLFSIQSNSEFFNFIGRPIMFVDDGAGDYLLLKNWANDTFLATVKVNNKIENGMQIMMKMLEEQPTQSTSQ